MLKARRFRKLSIVFLCLIALITLSWASVILTAIWLRGRCAGELAEVAQSIGEVHIANQSTAPASSETFQIEFGPIDVFVMGSNTMAQLTKKGEGGSFSIRVKPPQSFLP